MKQLRELGLIDENGKITTVGFAVLKSTINDAEKQMKSQNNGKIEMEFIKCYDKSFEDIEKWENENNAICVGGSSEGLIELLPTRFFHLENGRRIWSSEEALHVSILSDDTSSESFITLCNKSEMIKLRDYLTRFIEKEENWYKIEEN